MTMDIDPEIQQTDGCIILNFTNQRGVPDIKNTCKVTCDRDFELSICITGGDSSMKCPDVCVGGLEIMKGTLGKKTKQKKHTHIEGILSTHNNHSMV